MPHSFISNLVHYVFSTKGRRKLISSDLEERLWPYMAAIAHENHIKTLSIGGTEDHVHLLLSLPGTIAVSKAVQLIKGSSSKWVHDEFRKHQDFAWQEGYGAFSIGMSQTDQTVQYIRTQKEHHQKKTFQEELLAILKKHGIEYDDRYIWD